MIEQILYRGFGGLSVYTTLFAAASMLLYIAAAIANAAMRVGRFDLGEIRHLFTTNLAFSVACALLDYFLI